MCDCDGTLLHAPNGIVKKIGKWIAKSKIPWPIIMTGLLIINQRLDRKTAAILNLLHFSGRQVDVLSTRPEQAERYTEKCLKRQGVVFNSVKCVGSVEKKIEIIRSIGPDLIIDDDEEVVKICRQEGYNAFFPSENWVEEVIFC